MYQFVNRKPMKNVHKFVPTVARTCNICVPREVDTALKCDLDGIPLLNS